MSIRSTNTDMMDKSSPDLECYVGKILDKEFLAEGIYRILAKREEDLIGTEYFLVCEDAPGISSTAKQYGEHFQDVYLYRTADFYSGYKIVEYEMYQNMVRHKIPLPQGVSLHEMAHFATECHPEYFGRYPVPVETPNGLTTRHVDFENGICWVETDTGVDFLPICYAIWDGLLSDYAK